MENDQIHTIEIPNFISREFVFNPGKVTSYTFKLPIQVSTYAAGDLVSSVLDLSEINKGGLVIRSVMIGIREDHSPSVRFNLFNSEISGEDNCGFDGQKYIDNFIGYTDHIRLIPAYQVGICIPKGKLFGAITMLGAFTFTQSELELELTVQKCEPAQGEEK